MRLIDAKAGKKYFNAIAKPAEYKGVIHMVVPISELDRLPTIDAVPVGWIPVTDEREPLHGHGYFVAYRFDNYEMTFYGESKFYAYGSNGYVDGPHFAGEGMNGMKVTHWMEIPPLPELPKEVE